MGASKLMVPVTLTGLTVNAELPYTTNSSFSVASIGLDFKFGGPVVAKY